MKHTLRIEKEFDLKTLKVEAGVRYWEDATVNGESDEDGSRIPCRVNDLWCPEIDIDSGKILNWERGKTASIHFKVCDAGNYYVLDADESTVMAIENNYVPDTLSPVEPGYGDYIIMEIDADGFIKNWKFDPEDFESDSE